MPLALFSHNFEFEGGKLSKFSLLLYIFLLGYFSIAGTHDILAFLRAREHCTTYLEQDLKISPANIDGGFEYNAAHFYNYYYKPDTKRNWWWVQNDEYIVTWGEINGYMILKKEPYTRFLPPGRTDYYYVYKR